MPKELVGKNTAKASHPVPDTGSRGSGALAASGKMLNSLAELPERGRIIHRGYVESITILPAEQAPAFTVSVVDHPAPPGGRRVAVPHLHLIFVGQRRVPGILAGTRLNYEGMVAPIDGVATIYNPRYEILPERSSGQLPKPKTSS
ncbi:hypothetical protein [Arthrobacter sp. MYb227]|uniref:hypothetical protein n=1 Tax=Arthrobacter sp. MYb227 TaxID=1848601 RepID=UPI002158400A|nr:hypothetical protein [Arthrobacter sp. MYb227]